jgi:hypothetical protein
MGERCPTCGQRMPPRGADNPDLLLSLLEKRAHRMVYRGQRSGLWLLTHRSADDPVFYDPAIRELIARGVLHSCYSTCPDEAYWLYPTVDAEAVKAKRRKRVRTR